jgi:hypothetical protein
MKYDVIYVDESGTETTVGHHLEDRTDAADLARREAVERKAGRMMLPGSVKLPNCVCVIPVDEMREAA